jgi:hypothetical protein
MRKRVCWIRDGVDVEVHRVGQMTAAILGAAVKVRTRVMPGAVEAPDVGVSEMSLQPIGTDKGSIIREGHSVLLPS